jgi:hypothetical protein
MKIDVHPNATLKDIQTVLERSLTEGGIKFKLEKDHLDMSVDPFHGAVIRLSTISNIRKAEINPHMPIAGTLEMISSVIAFFIYQSLGRWYGIPAIIIAILWPILVGNLISRSITIKCSDILSRSLHTGIQLEHAPDPTFAVLPVQRVCLKCGNSLRPKDQFCEKCGERYQVEIRNDAPEKTMRNCPRCGSSPRFPNDQYCRKCGEKLT